MLALLNPRTWLLIGLALALAASHTFTYRAGRAAVRAEFDTYKIEQAAAAQQQADQHREAMRRAETQAGQRIAAAARKTSSIITEIRHAPAPDCRVGPDLVRLLNDAADTAPD